MFRGVFHNVASAVRTFSSISIKTGPRCGLYDSGGAARFLSSSAFSLATLSKSSSTSSSFLSCSSMWNLRNGACRRLRSLVRRVRIRPAECRSALSAAVCWPGVPITVTYTSAIDKSSDTFTRVMLGMPTSRGSESSRRIIIPSSCWIVLASRSVLRDMPDDSQQLNLIIHQIDSSHSANKIDQLAQRALHITVVVGNHRDSQNRRPMQIQRPHFCDRHVVSVGDAILQTFHDATLVLQAHRIANRQFQLKHSDGHE